LTRNIYPLKKKVWVIFEIPQELRKLINSKKFTKDESNFISVVRALDKIDAIRNRKKRTEVLTDNRDYYQKELKQKQQELRDKIDYNASLKDR
jgi:thymidine kinase